MITRRQLVSLALAATIAAPAAAASAERTLKAIHKRIGGRLGVHVLDSTSGKRFGIDENSRYAMASTFKLPLAAALLWQVDRKAFGIDRPLAFTQADLVPNSPVTSKRVAEARMSVRDLCAAAVVDSDNTAANILLAGIGGPIGFTRFMRSLGDESTHLERNEPHINTNIPGDPRDTTTPRAMVDAMLRIFTQDVLSLASRALLIDWMSASQTGLDRVRAGLPKGWNPGDKTGTGSNSAVNDLVIAYPPGRRPIFVAVYMSESRLPLDQLVAAQAEIGQLVASQMEKA